MGGNGARSGFAFEGRSGGSKCKCYGASCSISSLVVRQGTGCHPRHPPRAFPLGLLAPRCLGAVLLLASAPCSALARAPLHLGGERNPPPSFGLLLAVVGLRFRCRTDYVVRRAHIVRLNVPSESALAQPPSSFSIVRAWWRFRYWSFVLQ